jgi:hypothetical protein
MVLRNFIKIISGTVIFILMTFLFSCEDIVIIKCTECTSEEPLTAYLEITLDVTSGGSFISLYEGNLENGIILTQFANFSNNAYYKVPLNKSYTLTAEYKIEGSTYIVVNSVMPKVRFDEDQCTEPCYFIYDKKIDLRLKYTK